MRESDQGLQGSEFKDIGGITAVCRSYGCKWRKTGRVTIEREDGSVLESPLIHECRKHHQDDKIGHAHNQFFLFKGDEEIGFASVSTDSSCGLLNKIPA